MSQSQAGSDDDDDSSDLELFEDFFCQSSIQTSRAGSQASRRGSTDFEHQLGRLEHLDDFNIVHTTSSFFGPDDRQESAPSPSRSDTSASQTDGTGRNTIVTSPIPRVSSPEPKLRSPIDLLDVIKNAATPPDEFQAATGELRRILTQRARQRLTSADEAELIRRGAVDALDRALKQQPAAAGERSASLASPPASPRMSGIPARFESRLDLVSVLGILYEEGSLQEIKPDEGALILSIIKSPVERGDAGKGHRELRYAAVALTYHYVSMALLEDDRAVHFAAALLETLPQFSKSVLTVACCTLEMLLVDDAIAGQVTHLLPVALSTSTVRCIRDATCSQPLWRAYVRVLSLFYTDDTWLAVMRADADVLSAAASALHTLLRQVSGFKRNEVELMAHAKEGGGGDGKVRLVRAVHLLRQPPPVTPVSFQNGVGVDSPSTQPSSAVKIMFGAGGKRPSTEPPETPLTMLQTLESPAMESTQSPQVLGADPAALNADGSCESIGIARRAGSALIPRTRGSHRRASFHGLAKLVLGTRRGSLTLRAASKVETAIQMALDTVQNALNAHEPFVQALLSFESTYDDVAWLVGAGNLSAEAANVAARIARKFLSKQPELAESVVPFVQSVDVHSKSPAVLESILGCVVVFAKNEQLQVSGGAAGGDVVGWRALIDRAPTIVAAVAKMLPILVQEREEIAEIAVKTIGKVCAASRGVKELLAVAEPGGVRAVASAITLAPHPRCRVQLTKLLSTLTYSRCSEEIQHCVEHGVADVCCQLIFHEDTVGETLDATPQALAEYRDAITLSAVATLENMFSTTAAFGAGGMGAEGGRALAARVVEHAGGIPRIMSTLKEAPVVAIKQELLVLLGDLILGAPAHATDALQARVYDVVSDTLPLADPGKNNVMAACGYVLAALSSTSEHVGKEIAVTFGVDAIQNAAKVDTPGLHAGRKVLAAGRIPALEAHVPNTQKHEALVAELKETIADLTDQLDTATQRSTQLTAAKAEVEVAHEVLQKRFEEKAEELSRRGNEAERAGAAASEEKAALTRRHEDGVRDLEKQVAAEKQQREEAQAGKAAADAELQQARADIDGREAEVAKLKDAATAARAEMETANAAHAAAVAELEARLEAMEAKVVDGVAAVAAAENELAAAQDALKANATQLEEAVKVRQEELRRYDEAQAAAAAVVAERDAAVTTLRENLQKCSTELHGMTARHERLAQETQHIRAEDHRALTALRCQARDWQEMAFAEAKMKHSLQQGVGGDSGITAAAPAAAAPPTGASLDVEDAAVLTRLRVEVDRLTAELSAAREEVAELRERGPPADAPAPAADPAPRRASVTPPVQVSGGSVVATPEATLRGLAGLPGQAHLASASLTDSPKNQQFKADFMLLVQRSRELESALQSLSGAGGGGSGGDAPPASGGSDNQGQPGGDAAATVTISAKARHQILASYKAFAVEVKTVQSAANQRLDALVGAREEGREELMAIKQAVLDTGGAHHFHAHGDSSSRGHQSTTNPFEDASERGGVREQPSRHLTAGGVAGGSRSPMAAAAAASMENFELRQRMRHVESELQRRGGDADAVSEVQYLRGKLQSSLEVIASQSKELHVLRTQKPLEETPAPSDESREIEHLKRLLASREMVSRRREEVIALREEDCERREAQSNQHQQALDAKQLQLTKQEGILKDREKRMRKLEKRLRERDSGLCRKREYAVTAQELDPSLALMTQAHPFASSASGTYKLKKLEKEVARMVSTFSDGRIPFPAPVSEVETDIHRLLSEIRHIPLVVDHPTQTAVFLANLHSWWAGFRPIFADMYERYLQKRHVSLTDALNAYIDEATPTGRDGGEPNGARAVKLVRAQQQQQHSPTSENSPSAKVPSATPASGGGGHGFSPPQPAPVPVPTAQPHARHDHGYESVSPARGDGAPSKAAPARAATAKTNTARERRREKDRPTGHAATAPSYARHMGGQRPFARKAFVS